MAQCCHRPNDQLDLWKVQESHLDFFCTKSLVYTSGITALAVAILGAFALLGFFYPSSSFGDIGELLGDVGAYFSLGVGLTLFAAIIVARICYTRDRKEERAMAAAEITHFQPSVYNF